MNSFVASIVAIALAAPAPPGSGLPLAVTAHHSTPRPQPPAPGFGPPAPEPFRSFEDSYLPQVQNQVHIEQRVIIRIAPGPPAAREDMLAPLPRRQETPTRYREKKFSGCVPIAGIAGAQPARENRLLLFMRDNRVLSAELERACDPEAFYLGFYIERSDDGMLCSHRDKLQARTGARCEVAQLNRLVAIKD